MSAGVLTRTPHTRVSAEVLTASRGERPDFPFGNSIQMFIRHLPCASQRSRCPDTVTENATAMPVLMEVPL